MLRNRFAEVAGIAEKVCSVVLSWLFFHAEGCRIVKFVIIGSGPLAVECAILAADVGLRPVGVATDTRELVEWARRFEIPAVGLDSRAVTTFEALAFDYLVSVNNPLILRAGLLENARKLSVNYHDSLLPDYAGLNATSWALLEGERRHGICWHEMRPEVDRGPILVERSFEISDDDTVLSLNRKCFREALRGFEDLLARLGDGRPEGREQPQDGGSYFGFDAVPPGAGLLDFTSTAEDLERLSRSLEFGPTFNPLCVLKLGLGSGAWIGVEKVRRAGPASAAEAGVLIDVDDDGWLATTATETVRLSGFRLPTREALSPIEALTKTGATRGCRLPRPPWRPDGIAAISGGLKGAEDFWRGRLSRVPLVRLPRGLKIESGAESDTVLHIPEEDVEGLTEIEIITGFALVVSMLLDRARVVVGLTDEASNQPGIGHPTVFSAVVPIEFDFDDPRMTTKEWKSAAQHELELCRKKVTFATDLFLRDRSLPDPSRLFAAKVAIKESGDDRIRWEMDDSLLAIEGIRRGAGDCDWRLRLSPIFDPAQRSWMPARLRAAWRGLRSGLAPAEIHAVPADEQRTAIAIGSGTSEGFDLHRDLGVLLRKAARDRPDAVAVVDGDSSLTYGELLNRASLVAAGLHEEGLGRDDLIGVTTERSASQVLGLCAIAKIGAGFVALDPGLPEGRLRTMVDSSGLEAVLAPGPERFLHVPGPRVLVIDELMALGKTAKPLPDNCAGSDRPAYITFTSGSTGEPKGVVVHHRALVNFLSSAAMTIGMAPGDRILQFCNLSFDIAIEEIFGALTTGATLVLRDEECLASAQRFSEFIDASGITILDLPTAFFHVWIDGLVRPGGGLPESLRTVIVGGEVLSQAAVQGWFTLLGSRNIRLLNSYGPAEATVAVSYQEVQPGTAASAVGRMIPNVQARIVDRRGHTRPLGLEGEIVLSGECLAAGYAGRDDLTAKRFGRSFTGSGSDADCRFYRTGDRGWIDPDGTLCFSGRTDRQVKIRGFRVELEGVEATLCRIDGVVAAAVYEDSGVLKGVVAACGVSAEAVRAELTGLVPEYMVPAALVAREEIKLTPNAKIDREWVRATVDRATRAEPQGGADGDARGREGSTAEFLLEFLAEEIGQLAVEPDQDLFEVGLDSLAIVRLLSGLEHRIGVRVPMSGFLENPSVNGLVNLVGEHRRDLHVSPSDGSDVLTSFAVSSTMATDATPIMVVTPLGFATPELARCLDGVRRPVFGLDLQIQDHSGRPIRYRDLADLASHLIQSMSPIRSQTRRCQLIGYSFGGLAVCEMARQLERDGWRLEPMVLVDPSFPVLDLDRFRSDERVRAFEAGTFVQSLDKPENERRLERRLADLRDRVRAEDPASLCTVAAGVDAWRRSLGSATAAHAAACLVSA